MSISDKESNELLLACNVSKEDIKYYGMRVVSLAGSFLIIKKKPNFGPTFRYPVRFYVNKLTDTGLEQVGVQHTNLTKAYTRMKTLCV